MTTRALLILAAALAGCPTADPDEDRVQPPDDDDDDVEANWSGSVLWYPDDAPAVGVTVGLGGRTTETDVNGQWALPGPDEGPVQIDHYEDDGDVRSAIGCAGPVEQTLYDFGSSGIAGDAAVRFEVQGWTEATSIELALVYGAETDTGSWYAIRRIAAGGLTDEGDGVAATTMSTQPFDYLVAVASELEGGALARLSVVEAGPVADGELGIVTASLSNDGIVQGTWDGETRSGVSNLRLTQSISIPQDRTVTITALDRAPTGDPLPVGLYLPEGGTAALSATASLDDVWGCGGASAQRSGLSLDAGGTLRIDPFLDPLAIEPRTGEWGSRPDLAIAPLDPDVETDSVSISLITPIGSWRTTSDFACGLPEALTYPVEWDDLSVGDFVFARSYVSLEDGSLSCTNFGEVQPL